MPIRALLRTLAAGALIVASAGALAANATTRQASVALDSPAPPWAQPTKAPAPQARPLLAQVFFVDARSDQAARIRAQMERMEARARADDRLNGRVQPREGGGRGDWQQQQDQQMRQERGNPPGGYGNWHGNRRG
ncbi:MULTISPECIES: hypothetical protein [Ralstonia solanacearum species complex]|uniref:hypothetical protein n=1 Tax=Ralstonia solanacearum species complex TaxID=3116862 RepID=UPI000E56FE4C|nr:hypothetical protein [Ralstonia solanacearum]BEU72776.1 hypothetical protein MAFF211271_23310 [Ralstonia pseudosolanacearum]AXV77609.1 hypothetical protein CJO76_11940 [Ralstonia solanacearum]AXV91631.1 hypothetical protein CJO79_11920 [Ralstonia solanacearum]AXW19744.1 hypothetical protein CJO85_11980 [Ralstonia solanacearum]AXW76521.1 hypothetical protein CJO97_11910 [Ralstonia solanacearum]